MPSRTMNEATRRDWRELGFYYERHDESKTWRLLGTRDGLLRFAASLHEYAEDESKEQISEHEHFGPYWYLEVGTWHTPEITDHWLAGPRLNLARLARYIESELTKSQDPSVIKIRHAFAPESPYEFQLEVQPEGFDPGLADPACNSEA